MMQEITRRYRNHKKFKHGKALMALAGYEVKNIVEHKEQFNTKKGCCLGFFFLPLMILGRGKSYLIVTYTRRVENGKMDQVAPAQEQ